MRTCSVIPIVRCAPEQWRTGRCGISCAAFDNGCLRKFNPKYGFPERFGKVRRGLLLDLLSGFRWDIADTKLFFVKKCVFLI